MFLNPERVEPPDVDSDISQEDRPRAIQYLLDTYGEAYVSQIITFTKLQIKTAFKTICKALGFPDDEIEQASKLIPDSIDGGNTTIDKIMDIATDPDKYVGDLGHSTVKSIVKCADKFNEFIQIEPKLQTYLNKLSGCIVNTGIHAGGVIISSKKIAEHIPITKGSDTAVLPLVQLDMDDINYFNALKIDALGLATLTQIKYTMDLVGLNYEWFDSEDFSNPDVYAMLRDGHTADVFQMAKYGPTKMIKDMHVDSFEGLTVVNAGNRPGPLSKNPDTGKSLVDQYIENKQTNTIPKIDPRIDHILEETMGCLWYQEQCMALGQVMAGYSLGNADIRIRKTLGKKKVKLIPEIRAEYVFGKGWNEDSGTMSDSPSIYCPGAISNGFTQQIAEQIFDLMKEFAKYSFNKAHSGGYAALAYKTAELKLYYPIEFAIGCLHTHDNNDKVVNTLSSVKKMGYEILRPDINKSSGDFTVEIDTNGKKQLRFGLTKISNVTQTAVDLIDQLKPFSSLADFYRRVHSYEMPRDPMTNRKINNPINKRNEVPLIMAGAFDDLEPNRYKLLNEYFQVLRGGQDKDVITYKPAKYNQKALLDFEFDSFGMYVSAHPLDDYPYESFEDASDGDQIMTTGIVKKVIIQKTKRGQSAGKNYAKVIITPKDGRDINCMVFADEYEKYATKLEKGKTIIVNGVVNKQYRNIKVSNVRYRIRTTNENDQQVVPPQQVMPVRPDPHAAPLGGVYNF